MLNNFFRLNSDYSISDYVLLKGIVRLMTSLGEAGTWSHWSIEILSNLRSWSELLNYFAPPPPPPFLAEGRGSLTKCKLLFCIYDQSLLYPSHLQIVFGNPDAHHWRKGTINCARAVAECLVGQRGIIVFPWNGRNAAMDPHSSLLACSTPSAGKWRLLEPNHVTICGDPKAAYNHAAMEPMVTSIVFWYPYIIGASMWRCHLPTLPGSQWSLIIGPFGDALQKHVHSLRSSVCNDADNWTLSKPTITWGYSNVARHSLVSHCLNRPITTISMALTPFDIGPHWDGLIEPSIDFTSTVMTEVLTGCFPLVELLHYFVPSTCWQYWHCKFPSVKNVCPYMVFLEASPD